MTVIIIILALVIFTGCSTTREYKLTDKEYERLTQLDGPMFMYEYCNGGMLTSYEDYWSNNTVMVYYDGTIEDSINYNISGSFTASETISKEDYFTIYEFCKNWMQSDKCGAVDSYGCDNNFYVFYFYDEYRRETQLYYTDASVNEFEPILDVSRNYNCNIEINKVFNIYDYAHPGFDYVIKPYYPGSEEFDCKAVCPESGILFFDMIDIEGMEWNVYVLSEEPMEEDYDRIAAEEEPVPDIEKVPVEEGDWVLVYPNYTGSEEGFPENAYVWGYYRID